MLKTDPLCPLGFAPKLADFGLCKILGDADVVNVTGAGGWRTEGVPVVPMGGKAGWRAHMRLPDHGCSRYLLA